MFDHESVINSLAVIIVFSSAVTVKVIDAFLQPWTKHNATCILYGIPIRHVLLCSVRTDVFCNLLIFFFLLLFALYISFIDESFNLSNDSFIVECFYKYSIFQFASRVK